jgi:hypothetical protein
MKTLIGLPTLAPLAPPVVVSLMQLAAEARLHSRIVLSYREGLIPYDKGREALFDEARSSGCDYVLCLDADMLFPQDTFGKLLWELREHKAVAASGLYVRRGFPYSSVWSKKVGDQWFQVEADSGSHEIDMTGLGCCLLDFRWMERNLQRPFCTFERCYDKADVLDDESLFDKIRSANGKIIGVGDVQCGHLLTPEFVTLETANTYRRRDMPRPSGEPTEGSGNEPSRSSANGWRESQLHLIPTGDE